MFIVKLLAALFLCAIVFILLLVCGVIGIFRKAFVQFRREYDNVAHPQTDYENQEVVIDPRNASERSRKIISDDEGEYVDFESES